MVSGSDEESLDVIARTYDLVVKAGTHRASSIKVAEASKIIENTQRDVNIALINELSIIFNRVGINTFEVLEAAGTKWNFLKFTPGLVGGHCIGVDPYYLTWRAEKTRLPCQGDQLRSVCERQYGGTTPASKWSNGSSKKESIRLRPRSW